MKNKRLWFIKSICPMLLICATLFSGCAEQSKEGRESLSSADITQRPDAFEAVIAANAEAWNAKDLDAIRAVLTEDIHFVDVTFGDYLEGITRVMYMARSFCNMLPDVQRQVTSHYINQEDCIAIYDYWNLDLGSKNFTREDPLIHAFLFSRDENLISSWRLFYGSESMKDIHRISEFEAEKMKSLAATYAQAWSSKDPNVLAEMYAKDALRQDTLFGETQDGQSAIITFAESFFTEYPDAHWTPLEVFAERSIRNKPQGVGSSYKIKISDPSGQACEIEAVVLWQVLDGKIIQEELYYETESLIRCGWAQ